MEHQMKLNESPFEKIRSGVKIIEIRLYDDKRKNIDIGDTIIFSKLPDLKETLSVKVTWLVRYQSFEELLNDFSMDYFWCSNNYDKKSFIEAMYKIYTKEEEGKYWVLWIKIQLV